MCLLLLVIPITAAPVFIAGAVDPLAVVACGLAKFGIGVAVG